MRVRPRGRAAAGWGMPYLFSAQAIFALAMRGRLFSLGQE